RPVGAPPREPHRLAVADRAGGGSVAVRDRRADAVAIQDRRDDPAVEDVGGTGDVLRSGTERGECAPGIGRGPPALQPQPVGVVGAAAPTVIERHQILECVRGAGGAHSPSIVPGGFLVMSYATRFTPGTSRTIRCAIRSSASCGSRAQSAVIASSEVTTRTTTGFSYVRPSPITPTVCTSPSRTQNVCHVSRSSPAWRT